MDLFLQNLIERKKHLIAGIGAVVAGVVVLVVHFYSGSDAMSYANAEVAVAAWRASPDSEKLYATMRHALSNVPALGKKYEAEDKRIRAGI